MRHGDARGCGDGHGRGHAGDNLDGYAVCLAVPVSYTHLDVYKRQEKVILTALCGHGHLDLPAYGAYLAGEMSDHSYEEAEIRDAVAEALTHLPTIPG